MPKSSDVSDSYDDFDDDFFNRMLKGIASGDYDVPHISMSEQLAAPTRRDREQTNENRVRQLQRGNGKTFAPKPPRRVQGR